MSLPPLAALRVFEAVARQMSFTHAADELGMTQAGVSYQIRILEERLGGSLFLRRPRGIELTELGRRLAGPTTDAFDLLRDTYAEPEGASALFTITTFQTFAALWLSERLGRFQSAHPELEVRLDVSDVLADFAREDFDVAIRHGAGKWPGVTVMHLFDVEFTPMISARLADRYNLREPADLLQLPLLDNEDENWINWMQAAGLSCPKMPNNLRLRLGAQLHEARSAMAGHGVALLTPRFFKAELASGLLVQPFPILARSGLAYWLAYPHGRRNRPAIRKFRAFLLDELSADAG
ncbi:LysR substrate-binding domain-containing protein [Paracoccus sulfuroxidans]|uniref:LysR family glycine cleavage system transcriptional activator n=1 Tax=Paracoccus sulfuroxidans TaxID=384678 RepID=A0A562NC04_9RHOB|nr:LysR substrate-binding domain-containing protein [Paracoccus sulfuroxidans]TWI29654.1 LysR family glycine cleavage system transcriptional activator [Paracoccus sulfuroxidans]